MAAHSDYDFIGNYDEEREAGLLHVADHRFSPGKKQWTWGCGDFGKTWDRNLTDEDGPYIELMTGVYADNQPDFTWLKPHEEKTFVQYFMPYKGVGRVLNATKEASVGVENTENGSRIKVYATAVYPSAEITIMGNGGLSEKTTCDLTPEKCFVWNVGKNITDSHYTVTVKDKSGKELVVCKEYIKENKPIPDPAEAIKPPQEIKTCEELYLAGEHIEQYRHATFDAAEYYLEGLKRDPSDIRLNNVYGSYLYKNGLIKESIPYFYKAIEKQTRLTPNPYGGECYYNLGVALEALGEYDEAYDAFYKSTWSNETRGAGYYRLARIKCVKGEYSEASEFAQTALVRNMHDMTTRTLIAALNRKLGIKDEKFISESLAIDPLSLNLLYEQGVLTQDFTEWNLRMRGEVFNYLNSAYEYIACGLYDDAEFILSECPENPMKYYASAYVYAKRGKAENAVAAVEKADSLKTDYCFPSRIIEIALLENAVALMPNGAKAYYYLGNLYYDKKQYASAAKLWEKAVAIKKDFAMAHRNLSVYYFNKSRNYKAALSSIEKACEIEPDYPRFLLECDQLKSKTRASVTARLKTLGNSLPTVEERDDLYLRYISLLNCRGQYEKALECLKKRIFHPWEGGEGKVIAQYKFALFGLAEEKIKAKKYADAVELLEQTLTYPTNLGEGKLPNVHDNQAYYYLGVAYRAAGDSKKATEYFEKATEGDMTPSPVLYYNDQPSDYIYYIGLAHVALGQDRLAKKAFNQLVAFGERHIFDKVGYDYFAVSLPEIEIYQDELEARNRKYCKYMAALGYAGLNEIKKSSELIEQILEEQPDDQGAIALSEKIKSAR